MHKGSMLISTIYSVWLGLISFKFLEATGATPEFKLLSPGSIKIIYVLAIVFYFNVFAFWIYPLWENGLKQIKLKKSLKANLRVISNLPWTGVTLFFFLGLVATPVTMYKATEMKAGVTIYHLLLGILLFLGWLVGSFMGAIYKDGNKA